MPSKRREGREGSGVSWMDLIHSINQPPLHDSSGIRGRHCCSRIKGVHMGICLHMEIMITTDLEVPIGGMVNDPK